MDHSLKCRVLRSGLKTKDLELRPLASEATPFILEWRNDPSAKKWFRAQEDFTVETHEAWLSNVYESETDFNWVIVTEEFGPIGAVGLYKINWQCKTAEFGRFVIGARQASGMGFGKKALNSVLKLAAAAGLEHIYLEVRKENSRAVSLYKGAGFQMDLDGDFLVMSKSLSGLYQNSINNI